MLDLVLWFVFVTVIGFFAIRFEVLLSRLREEKVFSDGRLAASEIDIRRLWDALMQIKAEGERQRLMFGARAEDREPATGAFSGAPPIMFEEPKTR